MEGREAAPQRSVNGRQLAPQNNAGVNSLRRRLLAQAAIIFAVIGLTLIGISIATLNPSFLIPAAIWGLGSFYGLNQYRKLKSRADFIPAVIDCSTGLIADHTGGRQGLAPGKQPKLEGERRLIAVVAINTPAPQQAKRHVQDSEVVETRAFKFN